MRLRLTVAAVQVPLREAISLGLDIEKAIQAPEAGMIPWKSSQQVIISLRRFAKKYAFTAAPEKAPYNPARGVMLTPAGIRSAMAQKDVGEILGTEMKSVGMDKSLGGIVKRVSLLLLALVVMGAALFWLGLTFMFPEGI
jgi:hypothetical protein